ncbi:MAG: NPCBM/NEW2 domain-containing protein [Fibrobacterales bacterium]
MILLISILFILVSCDSNSQSTNPDDNSGITTTGNNITAKFLVADGSDSAAVEESFAYLFHSLDSTPIDSQKVDLINGNTFDSLQNGTYDIFVFNQKEIIGSMPNIAVSDDNTTMVNITLTIITQIIDNDSSTIVTGEEAIVVQHTGDAPTIIVKDIGAGSTVVINTGTTQSSNSTVSSWAMEKEHQSHFLSSSEPLSTQLSHSSSTTIPISSTDTTTHLISSSALISSSRMIRTSSVTTPPVSTLSSSSFVNVSSSIPPPLTQSSSSIISSSSSIISDTIYLSDLQSTITYLSEPSNDIEYDKNFKGRLISLNEIIYPKGIVLYEDSQIDFHLDKKWDVFEAVIGMDDKYGDNDLQSNVHMIATFEVILDGRSVYTSPELRIFSNSIRLKIDVKNVSTISLRTDETYHGLNSYVTWADAKVISAQTIEQDTIEVLQEYTTPHDYLLKTIVSSPNLNTGFSSCQNYSITNTGYQLCYNNSNGSIITRELKDGDLAFTIIQNKNIGNSWKHHDIYTINDTTYLMLYDDQNGLLDIRKIGNDGLIGDVKHTHTLETNILALKVIKSDSTHYLMRSIEATKETITTPLDSNSLLSTDQPPNTWSTPWTSIQYIIINDITYVYLNGLNSKHATYSLKSDGSLHELIEENINIRPWNYIRPFTIADKPYIFFHDTQGSHSGCFKLNTDGSIGNKLYYRGWSSGWTSIEPLGLTNNSYLFIHKNSSGRSELSTIEIETVEP